MGLSPGSGSSALVSLLARPLLMELPSGLRAPFGRALGGISFGHLSSPSFDRT